MGRSAVLSNGKLCVCLDEKGHVQDFYYPLVGQENMMSERFIHHKIGISIDGHFSWLDDSNTWHVEARLDEHTMMSRSVFNHRSAPVSLSFRDFVDNDEDFFGRIVIVENRGGEDLSIKLFFAQVFHISRNGRSDTALYVPARSPYILTYHRKIAFVTGLRTEDLSSFDQFAVGNYGIEGKAGTYKDAEDGELSGNLVEHAGVDSVIRTSFVVRAKHSYHIDYWICASDNGYSKAARAHRHIQQNGLYHYLNSTTTFWKHWLEQSRDTIDRLDVKHQTPSRKSLLTIKAHQSHYGGVLASADSSIYNYGRDYYNYVWPRDAYYALKPLLDLGYHDEIRHYLDFAIDTIHPRGYMHHKYAPDGSIGSSWHPMMQDGIAELNIQEDETASVVLLALDYITAIESKSYEQKLYKKLIKPAADFMAGYMDPQTGLPLPSYDLWEQVFLTSTYTVSTVYGALSGAAAYASQIGDNASAERWAEVAKTIDQNKGRLFDEKHQWFARGMKNAANDHALDTTLDIASLYGPVRFGLCKVEDTAIYATLEATKKHLISGGGVVRYENDAYMSADGQSNPWILCSLWLAELLDMNSDPEGANRLVDWCLERITEAGMLSEQSDHTTLSPRGVTPLVWSHAQYLHYMVHRLPPLA